jgi:predicted DNA-binding transcriptional regulator AlpA
MQPKNLPLYLDTEGAAKLLGLSRSSLEKYRHYQKEDGPPYVIFGRSAIRYHTPTLLEWAQERTVQHGRGAA